MNKNYVMIGLTLLVVALIIWRHKTCPKCQENLKAVKDRVTGAM